MTFLVYANQIRKKSNVKALKCAAIEWKAILVKHQKELEISV